jgi:hypothetical protein
MLGMHNDIKRHLTLPLLRKQMMTEAHRRHYASTTSVEAAESRFDRFAGVMARDPRPLHPSKLRLNVLLCWNISSTSIVLVRVQHWPAYGAYPKSD